MGTHKRLPCDRANYEDGALQQEYTAHVHANLETIRGIDERYSKAALDPDPKALYELMGEDCRSSSEELRLKGYIALYYSVIVLHQKEIDLLDERTAHRPECEYESGKDQRFVQNSKGIVDEVLKTIVRESALVGTNKHPITYFLTALKNWQINEWRRPYRMTYFDGDTWKTLSEAPPASLMDQLSAPSAEDEAMSEIAVDELGSELIQEGILTARHWLIVNLGEIDGLTSTEIGKKLEMTDKAVRKANSEHNRSTILRRDMCIAVKLYNWASHTPRCSYASRAIDFTVHHSDLVVRQVEEALKPALRASASLSGSEPMFLPLTPGIDRRPGRLYIVSGTYKEVDDNLCEYLLARGIDPSRYYLSAQNLQMPNPPGFPGFPILDEIIKRVREHCSNFSPGYQGGYETIAMLGMLNFKEKGESILYGRVWADYGGDFDENLYQLTSRDPTPGGGAHAWEDRNFCECREYTDYHDDGYLYSLYTNYLRDTFRHHPELWHLHLSTAID